MKTTMKKSIAYLLAVLLVFQIVPAFAGQVTGTYTPGSVVFREKLEITPEQGKESIMTVGMTNKLTITDNYKDINWSSDNPDAATVENGVVTAVGPGKVKITVIAEKGEYSDSITFRVMGPAASDNNDPEDKLVIIITGKKTKVTYDGQPHTNEYTVSSSGDYDESKLTVNTEKIGAGTDCWTYMDDLTADYDGDAEIVISNGWLQIKPKTITIKANDAVVEEGETPAYTATVSEGLVEGEELDLSAMNFKEIEQNGKTYISPDVPQGQIIGNYKVGKVVNGQLTRVTMVEMPLYNLAHFENSKDYYRLAKTTIKTTITDLKKNYSHKLTSDEYKVADYDFTDLVITDNNKKEYVFKCAKNAELIANGANYYTVSFDVIEICKQKIGGMNGSNPRWMIPEEQRYDDPNNTDSIHRNYTIHTHVNTDTYTEQTLYNMLTFTGSGNYYRLKKTTITAVDASTREHGKIVDPSEYHLHPYDFASFVITVDGVDYHYSDHELEGEYDPYYTIKLENVKKEDRVNNDKNWYNDPNGFWDGSASQYEGQPNEQIGYHANYRAFLHEGTRKEPEGEVTVTSSLEGVEKVFTGTEITLTAIVTGYENGYDLQWKYEDPAVPGELHEIPGETNDTYTFNLDSTNCQYIYYAIVTAK